MDRLAVARARRDQRQQGGRREPEMPHALDAFRSRHAADATIRAMTPGGGLLIALLLQSASAAPAAPPDAPSTRARLDVRGGADCVSRGDLAARVAARSPRIQFAADAAIFARVALTSVRPGNVVAEIVLATP